MVRYGKITKPIKGQENVVQRGVNSHLADLKIYQKEYPHQTRLTVGGNLINHPGEVGTLMSEMIVPKLLFNSVLLTPYSKFMGIDIKTFTST